MTVVPRARNFSYVMVVRIGLTHSVAIRHDSLLNGSMIKSVLRVDRCQLNRTQHFETLNTLKNASTLTRLSIYLLVSIFLEIKVTWNRRKEVIMAAFNGIPKCLIVLSVFIYFEFSDVVESSPLVQRRTEKGPKNSQWELVAQVKKNTERMYSETRL